MLHNHDPLECNSICLNLQKKFANGLCFNTVITSSSLPLEEENDKFSIQQGGNTFEQVEVRERALSFELRRTKGGQQRDIDHSVSLHMKEKWQSKRERDKGGEDRETSRSIGS